MYTVKRWRVDDYDVMIHKSQQQHQQQWKYCNLLEKLSNDDRSTFQLRYFSATLSPFTLN